MRLPSSRRRAAESYAIVLDPDLIDELSVLVAPVADGGARVPSLFDVEEGKQAARPMKLLSFARCKGDLLWMRYKRKLTILVESRGLQPHQPRDGSRRRDHVTAEVRRHPWERASEAR